MTIPRRLPFTTLILSILLQLFTLQVDAQTKHLDTLKSVFIDSLVTELGTLSQLQLDSLKRALMETFSEEDMREVQKTHDSLFAQSDIKRLIVPPDRLKNELLSKPVPEMPGITIHLSLPDNWKEIDPFIHQSMIPQLPGHVRPSIPSYAVFSGGMPGYYFGLQEMGYYRFFYPDTLQLGHNRHIITPAENPKMSPKLLKILDKSKRRLIILVVILQALLI